MLDTKKVLVKLYDCPPCLFLSSQEAKEQEEGGDQKVGEGDNEAEGGAEQNDVKLQEVNGEMVKGDEELEVAVDKEEKDENGKDVEEEGDTSYDPRLSTQLSLHEELCMSSNFAENSEDECEQEDESKEASCQGGGSHQEEAASQLAIHQPFCGRLTSSALSKAEEFSEPETFSSGFSEDFKLSHRQTQTDWTRDLATHHLAIAAPTNLDNHFHTTPRYKTIFKEIFEVLKTASSFESTSRQVQRRRVWEVVADYPSLRPLQTGRLTSTELGSFEASTEALSTEDSYATVLRRGIHP